MPQTTLVRNHTVHPFVGGQYSNTVGDLTPPGYLSGIQNAEFTVMRDPMNPGLVGLSVKKRGGTTRYNTVATSSQGLQWQAICDFWRYGTSLTPTQVFVGQAGATLYTDTGLTGTWLPTATTSGGSRWGTTGADVNITLAQGFAVLSNSNSTEVPQKYDQTSVTRLTSNAYQFTASVYHLRRLWGIGETASADGSTVNPSRATYSAAGDITTFTGADAGTFIFDEDDGDRLVGVSQPFGQQLYFFKGPQLGSIHAVWGTAPANFVRQEIFQGFPCVAHKSIITTPKDIYWASPYGIHSLSRTLAPGGDSQGNFLSYPIQDLYGPTNLNYTRLGQIVSFYHPTKNLIGWAFPTGSNTINDTCVVFDLITQQWIGTWVWGGKTSIAFTASCFMTAKTPTTKLPRLYVGGYDGFVRAADQTTQTDDNGVTYTYSLSSPTHLTLPDKGVMQEAQIVGVDTLLRPTGSDSLTLNVVLDGSLGPTSYSVTMNTGSGALIGSTFIVGTSVLGSGSALSVVPTPVEGRARSVQVQYSNSTASQDAEVYGYNVRYIPGDSMSQEVS